jgi:hypothetical protein
LAIRAATAFSILAEVLPTSANVSMIIGLLSCFYQDKIRIFICNNPTNFVPFTDLGTNSYTHLLHQIRLPFPITMRNSSRMALVELSAQKKDIINSQK